MTTEAFNALIYPEPNTGCWIYAGRVAKSGHGIGRFTDKIQLAHRFSYLQHYGQFNPELHVLHKCDVPCCVNPDHLYLGDQRQNNIDRDTRGRQKTARGVEHKLSRLTENDVRVIRLMHDPKLCSSRILAKMFSVSQKVIMNIIRKKSYKNVV